MKKNNMKKNTRKTYIVDISNPKKAWASFEKRTRYTIRKAEKNSILRFSKFQKHSFLRQKHDNKFSDKWVSDLFFLLKKYNMGKLYLLPEAGALVAWVDKKRAYWIMGGSTARGKKAGMPSLLVWLMIQDLHRMGFKELDMVGANTPSIAFFKRGFGGKLAKEEEIWKKLHKILKFKWV